MVIKDSAPESQTLYRIILFAIVLVLVFTLITGFFYFKISKQDICTVESIYDSNGLTKTNVNTPVMTDNTSYLLPFTQDVNYPLSSHFRIYAEPSDSAIIQIVDDENTVYGHLYMVNGTTTYESRIELSKNNNFYLGIKCINCNASNNVTLLKNFNGETKKLLVKNGDSISFETISLSVDFLNQYDCKDWFRKIYKYYFWIMLSLLMMVGILAYQQKISEELDIV